MEHRDFALRIKAMDNTGAFSGFASTYGQPADLVGDVVEPGAFKQSIVQQGLGFPLLWAHKQDEPIGLAKVSDSSSGLMVEGTLLMADPAAQRAYAHIKAGTIRGISIGFSLPRDGGKVSYSNDGTRILKEIHLHEISLVAVPANPRAQVVSVKTLGDVQRVLAAVRDPSDPEVLAQLRTVNSEMTRLLRKSALCACDCDECVAGDCADCSNADCVDPNCEGSMQTAAAEEELAALKGLELELKKLTA